jgi:type 1 glutamine amidotransferase
MGRVADSAHEPVAWTVEDDNGQRVFYTSLGSQSDFAQPEFRRLLRNAVYWSAGLEIPTEATPNRVAVGAAN